MKYLYQFGIIAVVCFIAELFYVLLKLPIPSSVYGLVIMFILLLVKVIKVEQVEGVSKFFLGIMPILFLDPVVSLITIIGDIKGQIIALLVLVVFSTVITILITGVVVQCYMKLFHKDKCKKKGEKDE